MTTDGAYANARAHLRKAATLGSIEALTSWDQETFMPAGAADLRAEQLQMLSGLIHEMKTDPRLGEWIEAAADEVTDDAQRADVREMKRDYDRNTKLPRALVEEMARCQSLGMAAWKDARQKSDFKTFLPWLEKTVELNRRKAECYGFPTGGELYDALLEDYEPAMTAAYTAEVFAPLRAFTVDLLDKVMGAPKVDRAPATRKFPLDQQRRFCAGIAGAMGFDYHTGRMDDTTHPFCSGFGPGDTRLTNRYRDDGWVDSLSSGTHEGGHGMYEQGLPKAEHFGSPLGQAVSLGIHESQSRLWENQVGRSKRFWTWALKVARDAFGDHALGGIDVEAIFRAANVIEPSFIRVESDELTYNLHIMLRFDLERAMLRGDLNPRDLPRAWNERMKNDFGLTVTEDRIGCLQDVHWSLQAIGYFPTYTFGNLYSAQLWEAMAKAIPDRDERMTRGDFKPILSWLREHVHRHGRRYTAEELCKRVTGDTMNPEPLMRHLSDKAAAVYGI
jgi:carboxypeptidase Taq